MYVYMYIFTNTCVYKSGFPLQTKITKQRNENERKAERDIAVALISLSPPTFWNFRTNTHLLATSAVPPSLCYVHAYVCCRVCVCIFIFICCLLVCRKVTECMHCNEQHTRTLMHCTIYIYNIYVSILAATLFTALWTACGGAAWKPCMLMVINNHTHTSVTIMCIWSLLLLVFAPMRSGNFFNRLSNLRRLLGVWLTPVRLKLHLLGKYSLI